MNEAQLRKKLAQALKRADVPEPLWKELVEDDWVLDALDKGREDGFPGLVRQARRRLRTSEAIAQRTPPPGRTASAAKSVSLQPRELLRAEAFSAWLSHHVTAIPRVRRLRQDLFGGGVLSAAQAEALLQSPAPRFLSAKRFHALGIPLLGHTAHLVNTSQDFSYEGNVTQATLQLNWPGGTHEESCRWEDRQNMPATRIRELVLPRLKQDWIVKVWPSSVFGELSDCSAWLAERYAWPLPEALWFLLTGDTPPMAPLRLGVHGAVHSDLHRYTITLTVEPWISADTVLQAYRAVQDMVLQGQDNRPLGERSLTLLQFVAEHGVRQKKRPGWNAVMTAWNRAYPQWAYDRLSNFAKDADRIELAVRFPKHEGTWGQNDNPWIRWQTHLDVTSLEETPRLRH